MNESGTPDIPSVPGFELRRLLGRGAQAEVWLALDLARSEQVALKLRPAPPAAPPAAWPAAPPGAPSSGWTSGSLPAARLGNDREVLALRRIDHPNLVRLHRVTAVSGGGVALVLEYAAAGSLRDLMTRRPYLDPPEVTGLLVPLARGLAHLHHRGLVHGDVAPGNVLFAADGRPLLSDLGATRVLGVDPDTGLGTAGFADPALVGPADPAADVRALAAVAWYALTGLLPADPADGAGAARSTGGRTGDPFDPLAPRAWQGPAEQLADRLHRCWAELPARRDETHPFDPTPLIAVLARCLQADRADRPSAADLVRQAWAACTPAPIRLLTWGLDPDDEQPTVGAGPADVTRRLRAAAAAPAATAVPSSRRRPRLPAMAATLLAVGAAAGAGWQLADGRLLPVGSTAAGSSSAAPAGPGAGPSGGPSVRPSGAAPRPTSRQPSGPASAAAVPPPVLSGESGPAGTPTKAEAQALLRRLSDGRAAALQAGSADGLARVDAPGSPALAADVALLDRLQQRGLRLDGLSFRLADIRVTGRGPRTVTLELAVAASPHRRLPLAGGGPAVQVAGGSLRPVRVVLVRVAPGAQGWRVREVSGR